MNEKDPAILEDFFSFSFSSFPSTVTHAFPWPIKGKAGRPMKGTQNPSNLEPIRTHKHIARKQSSSRYLFAPLTRDLGLVPLSTVYNPYYKLLVLVTRVAATNWTEGHSARTSINLMFS